MMKKTKKQKHLVIPTVTGTMSVDDEMYPGSYSYVMLRASENKLPARVCAYIQLDRGDVLSLKRWLARWLVVHKEQP
jgi:hypothetical protein